MFGSNKTPNSNKNINTLLSSNLNTNLLDTENSNIAYDSDEEKPVYDFRIPVPPATTKFSIGKSQKRPVEQKSVELIDTPHSRLIDEEEKEQKQISINISNKAYRKAPVQPKPTADYEIKNRAVYYSCMWIVSPAIVVSRATFGVFCFKNTYNGLNISFDALAAELSASAFSQMKTIASPAGASYSAVSEFGNSITQINLKTTAANMDTLVSKLSFKGTAKFVGQSFCQTPAKFGYVTVSLAAFMGGALITSFGSVDEVIQPFRSIFGEAFGNILSSYIFMGAVCYFGPGFVPGTLKGIEAWWELPYKAMQERVENHGSLAIEVQYSILITLGAIVNPVCIQGYLGMGFADKVFGASKTAGALVGMATGFFQGIHYLTMGLHYAVHKGVDKRTLPALNDERKQQNELIKQKNKILVAEGKSLNPLKPVVITTINQHERNNAYIEYYGNMSYKDRIVRELKRPLFVGFFQSALSMYAIKAWAGSAITSAMVSHNYATEESANGFVWSAATLGALIAYYPYYKLTMYVELNRLALHLRDKNQPAPRVLNGEIVGETNDPLTLPNDFNLPTGIQIAPDELNILSQEISEQLTSIYAAVTDNNPNLAMRLLQTNKANMLRLGMKTLFNDLEKQLVERGAEKTEEKEEKEEKVPQNPVEDDEEDIQVHSRCSRYTAQVMALGMAIFRIPMSVNGYVKNPICGNALSAFNWLVIATGFGVPQATTLYHAMEPNSEATLHAAGKSIGNSRITQTMFSWFKKPTQTNPDLTEPKSSQPKAAM